MLSNDSVDSSMEIDDGNPIAGTPGTVEAPVLEERSQISPNPHQSPPGMIEIALNRSDLSSSALSLA